MNSPQILKNSNTLFRYQSKPSTESAKDLIMLTSFVLGSNEFDLASLRGWFSSDLCSTLLLSLSLIRFAS